MSEREEREEETERDTDDFIKVCDICLPNGKIVTFKLPAGTDREIIERFREHKGDIERMFSKLALMYQEGEYSDYSLESEGEVAKKIENAKGAGGVGENE